MFPLQGERIELCQTIILNGGLEAKNETLEGL
jgi:hypothetical protein